MFMKHGNIYAVHTKHDGMLFDVLPAGTFVVEFHPLKGYYLQQVPNNEIPKKLYSDTLKMADRILNTYKDRGKSTGVLLSGVKGSGKTLLAKVISSKAREKEMPTILVNEAFCGDGFNALLQAIDQPAVVLFDEFEKVYDKDDQKKLLTTLDGVYSSSKLFILTCNNKYEVNDNMRNRPGRLYYMLDFESIDANFIKEYCADVLQNQKHLPAICMMRGLFLTFTFDMLQALVEEVNRYDESPHDAVKMLNVKYLFEVRQDYDITVKAKVGKYTDHMDEVSVNPLTDSFRIYVSKPTKGEKKKSNKDGLNFIDFTTAPSKVGDDSDVEQVYVNLSPSMIVRVDENSNYFMYETDDEYVTLTRRLKTKFDHRQL